MLVLRKDERVGIRADARVHVGEHGARGPAPSNPEIRGGNGAAAIDNGLRQRELTVQLEGTRLHGKGPRRRAGLRRFVHNAHPNAELCEPKRQHQTGRAGANDQNGIVAHVNARTVGIA